jgi:hypothetical protein
MNEWRDRVVGWYVWRVMALITVEEDEQFWSCEGVIGILIDSKDFPKL